LVAYKRFAFYSRLYVAACCGRLKTRCAMCEELRKDRVTKPYLWPIRVIGVIVPRRFRADWRGGWGAGVEDRGTFLSQWDKLDKRQKIALFWPSPGAVAGGLWFAA